MKTRSGLGLLFGLAITLIFFSCGKEKSDNSIPPGMNKLSVYLTDGPADYQHVYIDIQSVEVKLDSCNGRGHDDDDDHGNGNHPGCDDHHDSLSTSCEYWQALAINPGVYDLLTLSNGVDTLLASGFLLNGHIKRIKITLGSQNSVVVDSITYPLTLPGNNSSVYINLGREHLDSLSSNTLQLFLDFDVEHSIVHTGNGRYILRPVLHAFSTHATGEIEGLIRPRDSYQLIKAFSSTDTGYARPTPRFHEGEFKIRGLDAGTYSVYIQGRNGYQDTTITGVQVSRGRETEIGSITLHQ